MGGAQMGEVREAGVTGRSLRRTFRPSSAFAFLSNASIFRVCARHRSASTIWRWSSDSSSVGACFASPAFCTA